MAPLDPMLRSYLASAYPRNHRYRVLGGRAWPGYRLYVRYRRISALYPRPLESLVDLSSSLGYFVLDAAARFGCGRVLGIDLHEPDLQATTAVRDHLGLPQVRLERMRLHELAERIEDFGGTFQTALLVNSYHYFYFGSRRSPERYETHEQIFEALAAVCSGSVVFSNCVEPEQLPPHMLGRARSQGRTEAYHERDIRAAAEKHFLVEEHGVLGRRPLWRLIARVDPR